MTLLVQLIILASASWRSIHFGWWVYCLSHIVLRMCPAICKSGGTPRALW